MRGSARIARAIATRWRCPPDSFTPRSPTTVSYFFSNSSMNSSACAMRLTSRISSVGRVLPSVADVVADGAVEQEVVLQHDAELRAVVAQADASARSRPSIRMRPHFGRLNAMTRLMSVLFPDPLEPTSAVVVPAGAREGDVLQHRHAGVVLEGHVLEHDLAVDRVRAAPACCPRRPRSSSCISSWMRSRPANASLICVPIDAICTTGAAISPVNRM